MKASINCEMNLMYTFDMGQNAWVYNKMSNYLKKLLGTYGGRVSVTFHDDCDYTVTTVRHNEDLGVFEYHHQERSEFVEEHADSKNFIKLVRILQKAAYRKLGLKRSESKHIVFCGSLYFGSMAEAEIQAKTGYEISI